MAVSSWRKVIERHSGVYGWPQSVSVNFGYEFGCLVSTIQTCLIFLSERPGRIELRKSVSGNNLDTLHNIRIGYANNGVPPYRRKLLVPDLQIIRLLDVGIEKLPWETGLLLSEPHGHWIAEGFAHCGFNNF
jgi:hypothetical protein